MTLKLESICVYRDWLLGLDANGQVWFKYLDSIEGGWQKFGMEIEVD